LAGDLDEDHPPQIFEFVWIAIRKRPHLQSACIRWVAEYVRR